MDPSGMSDEDLEARLRQLAFDEFNAELQIDHTPETAWRARCMVHNELGTANMFSVEGAESRGAALEALARSFDVKHMLDERRREP